MKRSVQSALLCIGVALVSAIVCATVAERSTGALLSDHEMTQVRGSCGCYDGETFTTCRAYGDMECTSGGGCGSSEDNYHDNYFYSKDERAPDNSLTKWRFQVPCYTETYVVEDGYSTNQKCNADYPPPCVDMDDYGAGYYHYCSAWTEQCEKCAWGEEKSPTVYVDSYECI